MRKLFIMFLFSGAIFAQEKILKGSFTGSLNLTPELQKIWISSEPNHSITIARPPTYFRFVLPVIAPKMTMDTLLLGGADLNERLRILEASIKALQEQKTCPYDCRKCRKKVKCK